MFSFFFLFPFFVNICGEQFHLLAGEEELYRKQNAPFLAWA